ncbi:Uncharacterised protein [[Clostridium] sordellii]|nr:Uncharacterised protein [[Clostridium] sordellii] [Paeniclostridium sordellii]CEP43970.1 Uncharacterised protein [[Clostridium] sordellii] [Paeniclostridium sordellii]CEQ17182.1 Uncharacterised protein [[Clostridium] sordellii] [Paeniclostridium sordellii]
MEVVFIYTKKEFLEYINDYLTCYKLQSSKNKYYLETINSINKIINDIHKSSNYINSCSTFSNLENSYCITHNIKADLKNAMILEYKLFTKYINNINNIDSSFSKQNLQNILSSKLESFNLYKSLYDNLFSRDSQSTTEIYFCEEFFLENNTINLIINSIKKDKNILYLDGYMINLKKVPLSSLFNFYLELRDNRGVTFANKLFKNIDIGGNLGVLRSKKVLLTFLPTEYELFGSDLSNITWYYTYDFI